ncbi:MAG: phytase, partial [Acinetobacter sp.]
MYKLPLNAVIIAVPLIVAMSSTLTKANTVPVQANTILNAQPLQPQSKLKVEAGKWLHFSAWPHAKFIQSSKTQGLQILDQHNRVLSNYAGQFTAFDYRANTQNLVLAAIDSQRQQVAVFGFDQKIIQWQNPIYIPKRNFKVESLCMYQDDQNNSYAFLNGESGFGEQWLIAQNFKALQQPRLMRGLSLPPKSQFCQVNDLTAQLIVNEEHVGLWAYSANPETALTRQVIDLVKPYGAIQGNPAGIGTLGSQLVLIDAEKSILHRYEYHHNKWQPLTTMPITALKDVESIDLNVQANQRQILMTDDGQLKTIQMTWAERQPIMVKKIPFVTADEQTDVVPHTGDAADDPAIWYNEKLHEKSRILGTDKQGGLQVTNLSGKTLQYLPVGRLNNVDVRHGFQWGKQVIDLAIATNRDHNSLHVFAVQPDTGVVSELGEIKTNLTDIYGLCMYKDQQGKIYAIPNDKNGTFVQYEIQGKNQQLTAREVQRFAVKTQPEGCVVDDASGRIFLGEED